MSASLSSPPARADATLLDLLLWPVLIGGAIASGGLWAVGQIAGRVFRGSWPDVGAGDMGRVLLRFPQHLSDPALAWPADQQSHLPGAVGFYAVVAILAAPLLAVGVCWIRWTSRRYGAMEHGAQWATPRDLAHLVVKTAHRGRLVLGRHERRLVATEERHSVVVFGPTQTGKTTGLAIPAILEWDGPVICTSVKTDLLRETLAARRRRDGQVLVYDPSRATGHASCSWSPLASCGSWGDAQRMASALTSAGRGSSSGVDNAEFWLAAAAKLLAPLLFAARLAGYGIGDVVRWLDRQEADEVREIFEFAVGNAPGDAERRDAQFALDAAGATWARDVRTRSSIYTTAEIALAAYADPGVLSTAGSSDLSASRLLDGGRHTVYLCAPSHEQRRLRPLFSALVQDLVTAAYEHVSRTGQPLDPPLLVVLDEAANIAPVPQLDTLASTGAGQGIQLVSIFQDMAQVEATYGRDRAPTIIANHRAKLVLSGISDRTTLEYVALLLGDASAPHRTETTSTSGYTTRSETIHFRQLASADVLRQLQPGEGVLVYGHLPPAKLELRPWFREPTLRRLVEEA